VNRPAGLRVAPSLIFWGGAMLALSLLASLGLAAALLWRDGRQDAEDEVRRLVRLLAQHAARTVEPVDRSLTEVQRELMAQGFGRTPLAAAHLHDLLVPRAEVGRQLQRLGIVAADGTILAVSDQAMVKPGVRADDPWYAELAAARPGGLTVHPQRRSRFVGTRVVPMARVLVHPDSGAFLGAVVGAVDAGELEAFHSSLRLGPDWHVDLLRSDGMALASEAPARPWAERVRQLPAAVEEGVNWREEPGGEWIIGLHRVGSWPLLAAVAVRADAIVTPWRQQAMAMATIGVPGALALLGLAGLGARAVQRARGLSRSLGITEARYQSLVESSPDGIVLARDGRIDYANEAMLKLTGAENGSELVGRRVDELLDGVGEYHRSAEFDGPPQTEVVRIEHTLRPLAGPHREVETLLAAAPRAGGPERGGNELQIVVRDISARRRLQRELEASRRDVESLAMAAENAREREKRRIARELHDELGQVLTVQQLDLEMMSAEAAGRWPELLPRLEGLHARVDDAIAMTRRISGDLRPLVLDDLGLVAALEWLVGQLGSRAGLQGRLLVRGDPTRIADDVATPLFRIAQESVTNVMRHAQASHVLIELEIDGEEDVADAEAAPGTQWAPEALRAPALNGKGSVRLTVTDDGRGIERSRARRRGLGLRGIEERVRLFGGHFEVAAADGGGTRVQVQLPLSVAALEPADSGPQDLN
jgi:PAS domain S-box-containing protein